MQVAVVDTETTGFVKPVVPVEVCMIELEGDDPREFLIGEVWKKYFNPGKEIELGAMSTHLISNEQVQGQPKWNPALLPAVDMFIGHSIDYDWEAVGSPPGVRRTCTYALAKRAWPDLDSHKLGSLLIHVLGAKNALPLLAQAHQAEVDATNCIHLIRAIARDWDISSWEELWEMSEVCRIPTRMSFGKHGPDKTTGFKGLTIAEMVAQDRQYCANFLLNPAKVPDLDPYLRIAIENAMMTA